MSRIYSIQALRAVAAALVAFYHVNGLTIVAPQIYTAAPPLLFNFDLLAKFGGFGVDLFFILSGFVMAYITWNAPRGSSEIMPFLQRRIVRIVPTYWFYTLFLCAYLGWIGISVLPSEVLYSLTFIPYTAREGMSAPILAVGWTLSYEIYFYILVAIGLLLPRRTFILGIGAYFAVCILSQFWYVPSSLILGWITSSTILEFYFGMLICLAWLKYGRVNKLIGWAALAISFLLLALWARWDISLHWRGLVWGIPAAGIVLWFLSRESSKGFFAGNTWQELGASSYSLYLIHMPAFSLLAKPFVKSGLIKWLPHDVFVIMVGVLSIFLGHVLYLMVERPLHHLVTSVRPAKVVEA